MNWGICNIYGRVNKPNIYKAFTEQKDRSYKKIFNLANDEKIAN